MSFTLDDARDEAQQARRFRHHHLVCRRSIECDCDEVFGVEPDDDETPEPEYCRVCDGTGEGRASDTTCGYCRGTGFQRSRA